MIMLMMAAISTALGLERRLDGGELRTQANQHLLQHMIAADAQAITGYLHLRVPIAEVPGQARQLVRVDRSDFDQRLRPPDHAHNGTILQHQAIAVAQHRGLGQIEQECRPFLAGQHDAATLALVGVEHDAIDDTVSVRFTRSA
jgi:hypothetical protein